ncbi:hypothetical protein [Desulfosporosinus metallidurans]|uniref:Uncharacterized protein n=1 Tax=Desulfosporosinus metallidurans TaxID=1888891 RepID=A0A1Q8QJJ2_9FIRM|nr:hypothetical protein [Desulfosporosinus metallidurans]OLN27517.1 hypothetical protein DSOL_4489 [Desulfosporosinus metallidurans]
MAYIHVYQANPTVGLTDGVQVSEDGTQTSPIAFTLNATTNEEGAGLKLALRCEAGFQTTTGVDTVITPVGATSAKWALSLDNSTWSDYGVALHVTAQVMSSNVIFYVKAKASNDEIPQNDISVTLNVITQVETQ